jgi:branched-chain amino acid aminotransferase
VCAAQRRIGNLFLQEAILSTFIPYHERDGFIWMDGDYTPWRDAKVHMLTHALHYGSSVFEGERAYGGRIFKSRAHTDRLLQSGELMGFEIPWSAAEIETVKADYLKRTGYDSAYARPIAWRGSEQIGVSAHQNTIHLAIAIWQWGSYYADKMKGIRLTIADWRRPPAECAPVKAKAAGLYMICTLAKHKAEAGGYNDALMYDYRGRVAECTGAHVFFVKDGALHSPTGDILLDGITRRTIIEIAGSLGIAVHERDIMPEELPTFEECFIVGTAAEVTPVREIKGIDYKPGEITRTIVEAYDKLVRTPVVELA